MTKNIKVTDENGIYLGNTYLKRAKGLVKNGRALFVDDCTIRLSAQKAMSDDKMNDSEEQQMKYIFFNPREWSVDQTQNNGTNSFFQGVGQVQNGNVERSFINEFDGGLVESLMLGGWDIPYVRVCSQHYALQPQTEYSFVFWLNGGENDKNSEVCQLQLQFFGNTNDSYIYKLNRNYIKPKLHKAGWELYIIPFATPAVLQGLVDVQFAFVSGNAPMAVKPAKEPDFYADWVDEPDEFANMRPQRHNIVFEDGWPDPTMYGGDKYSTEVLRGKCFRGQQVVQGMAENVQQAVQDFAVNAKEMAKGFAKSTKQMGEDFRDSFEFHMNHMNRNKSKRRDEVSDTYQELNDMKEALKVKKEEVSEFRNELEMRFQSLVNHGLMNENMKTEITEKLYEAAIGISCSSQFTAIDAQLSCIPEMIANQEVPVEAPLGILGNVKGQLSNLSEQIAQKESILDEIEDALDQMEV